MKNVRFVKNPGYMYDLFFLFTWYFNRENEKQADFVNYNNPSEDIKYFNGALENFLPISDELFPFFYLKENRSNFMVTYYFNPYDEDFLSSYNIFSVQSALADYNAVIENLIKFYFMDISEEVLNECKNSLKAICKLIKESDYNNDVKSSLYSFFSDPIPVIQKLIYELNIKEALFSRYYEIKTNTILEFQNTIDIDDLIVKLKKYKNVQKDISSFDDIYISVLPLFKNCISVFVYSDKAIVNLGLDYNERLDFIISNDNLNLDDFGTAISEKNRVDILNLVLRKEEITIKDIEQELGFTGTNSYYHLSLMIKAKLIKTRNQGRTVLYSINDDGLFSAIDLLKSYIKKN